MSTVAFIGLGAMGAPMAGHLLDAGHALRVHARRAEMMVPLAARGAVAAAWAMPATAARAKFVPITQHTKLGEGAQRGREAGREERTAAHTTHLVLQKKPVALSPCSACCGCCCWVEAAAMMPSMPGIKTRRALPTGLYVCLENAAAEKRLLDPSLHAVGVICDAVDTLMKCISI